MHATPPEPIPPEPRNAWVVFLAFLRLGLTAFGGPIAHLAYFRDEFVTRRRWLGERDYADLVALCQFLPGPASSQVGLAIGLQRAGYRGALAAWAGFTLPSALLLIVLGSAMHTLAVPAGVLQGLKLVAVAVVAQAVWSMARSLCPDMSRRLLMLAAAAAVLLWPTVWTQLLVIGLAAAGGQWWLRTDAGAAAELPAPQRVSPRAGLLWLTLFAVLLGGLPLLLQFLPDPALARFEAFYRAGALVFGGGHVVLPLLQATVVTPGWVDAGDFVAGYGMAQAVPGPLFTFAAFLGAAATPPSGWTGGLLCLLAIFLPAFLLVVGALPYWNRLRGHGRARAALAGVNAAVVGILLAALYDPLWTGSIHRLIDLLIAGLALLALLRWRLPPWRIVVGCALAGWLVA